MDSDIEQKEGIQYAFFNSFFRWALPRGKSARMVDIYAICILTISVRWIEIFLAHGRRTILDVTLMFDDMLRDYNTCSIHLCPSRHVRANSSKYPSERCTTQTKGFNWPPSQHASSGKQHSTVDFSILTS